MSDSAFKAAPFAGYTTAQLQESIDSGRGNPVMTAEIIRRGKVAAGDRSVMTDGEKLRYPPPPCAVAFKDFNPVTLPAIPAGFVDSSWKNDICPSFSNEALNLKIWVDFEDTALREFADGTRFHVTDLDGCTSGVNDLDTDSWDEVLAFVEGIRLSENVGSGFSKPTTTLGDILGKDL